MIQAAKETPRILDTLRFPLHGLRLIEASAGTGKTFTIAGLYLRLLLGHGPVEQGERTAHAEPLSVTQILVVTFTEAATAELRGRIRDRIHQARRVFERGALAQGQSDALLATLLVEVPDHEVAARRLLAAERQMDEAAIFTIHGFCQRMLRQHAFESGALFASELQQDDGLLKLQAMADYWRQAFYGQPMSLQQAILQHWGSPVALLAEVDAWFNKSDICIRPDQSKLDLDQWHTQQVQRVTALKAAWQSQLDEVRRQVEGQVSRYTGKSLATWLSAILDWSQDPLRVYDWPEALEKFQPGVMAEKLTKSGVMPDLPLFAQTEAFLAQPAVPGPLILQQAAAYLRERLHQAKQREGLLGFDDLLLDLDRALQSDLGERLAAQIRQQYRVAMIDEFQDTDPQQYRIFSKLYAGQPELGLLMIGDPKQAIYGFRGADIFTYMQARQAVTDHYTLGTNYRSTKPLVSATNALFARAKAPFIYDQQIPFSPVAANGQSDTLTQDGQPIPALTCWLHPARPVIKAADYERDMANATAHQILTLLSAAQQHRLLIGQHPLQAGDIAILVRTGREADKVRQALARLGIASVYLSARDSVFESAEAEDLQLLLAACMNPENESALRAALGSRLFELDAAAIDALGEDERAWEATLLEFREYQQIWQKRGVLSMLRSLIHRRDLAAVLLGSTHGERRLTNLLHLGELLQAASQALDGEYALLRWLGEALLAPGEKGGDQLLRLESERKLVQVVTIHKSKGLQYPLVFLPFICRFRDPVGQSPVVQYHQGETSWIDLMADEAAEDAARQEALAEDLRLLYVALTRAIYATWLGLAPLRVGGGQSPMTDLHRSAIGYLLQGPGPQDAEALTSALQALARPPLDIQVIEPPLQVPATLYQPDEQVLPDPQVRDFHAQLEHNWWISSYTGLSWAAVQQAHQHKSTPVETSLVEPDHAKGALEAPGFDTEVLNEPALPVEAVVPVLSPARSIFSFPRGARAGTLLHSLFEELDFVAVHQAARQRTEEEPHPLLDTVTEILAASGFDPDWAEVLARQVDAVLATDLGAGCRLGDLAADHRQAELEFMLPMANLTAARLNTLLLEHEPLAQGAAPLDFAAVQGMLKGFIDLVFEYQGRWYVVDYKSNHLGDGAEHYQESALCTAMRAHRYDLQFHLYTLALHRLLQQRLPGYQAERHLGGSYYLFLRGLPEGGIFYRPVNLALLHALDQLFKGADQ